MITDKLINFLQYISSLSLKQQIAILFSVFLFSLAGFILYDLYRVNSIIISGIPFLKKEPPKIAPTKSILSNDSIFFNKPSRLCHYEDIMTPNVKPQDKDDDIQKIIGYQNNKVGLYIYAEVEDFTKIASDMINSNGGQWGYVLVPFNVKDRNDERWGSLFARLKELKLIPIIQLHDIDLDKNKADEQTKDAAKFLNKLMWPIKYRYISAYNEMNDKNFWKGKIDPEGYAKILDNTISTFKSKNENFFIMNGAFNSSARTGNGHLDTREYMARMDKEVPGIFKKLDGWASHPYPQPNFTGKPNATGRDSIQAYKWELEILKNTYHIETDKMPVFITETGWPHKQAETDRSDYLDQHKVADYMRIAYENVWLPDKNVVAVTPFTIKYEPPHDNFSWIKSDNSPYPQYNSIKDMKKTKGKPPVIDYILGQVLECTYE